MSDESDENVPEPTQPAPHDGPSISVEQEMQRSYLDYAMSVIVARAIPDLRDGLKPVHRRILFAMNEAGYEYNKPYRKSARVVGDVIGKYHPHGEQAVYDALVRMAQDFSMSATLLDGQGNFGSMDGDPPAAQRYTEVRMEKIANSILADIDKNTVDFQPNYDNQDREPTVLPARYPNLLVNGAAGIAVGMATNIPPHNLGEVIDGTLALIENPEMSIADLMEYIPGPDFPTGGTMIGQGGARKAYNVGRGSVIIRAKTHIEEIRKDRWAIIVDEIPYQVNKASLETRINELVRDKRLEGIAHTQDESDRHGVRLVIELKRDATPEVVLNQLYRHTPLQTSFGANMLALNEGRPEQLDLKRMLECFVAFREEVVARRTAFELQKARERAHILCGLAVAVENVDEVVKLIRSSADPAEARERLMAKDWPASEIGDYIELIDDPDHKMNADGTYRLSEIQARAILDLRLQRLTAMGRDEITDELKTLAAKIKDFLDILRSRERILSIISDELRDVKEEFAVPRRTEIGSAEGDMDDEDLIEVEDMVVTATHSGYLKRTPLADFREQKRGGKGLSGTKMKEEDFVTRMFVATTHTPVLFFTTDGMVYKLKTWRLPAGGRTSRGKAAVNLLPIQPGTSIAAMMPVDVPEDEWEKLDIVFATSDGDVRRNALSDFTNVMSNGKIAMKLPEGVTLVGAAICSPEDDFLLATAKGKAIRFAVSDVRVFKGRNSTGVRGIKLVEDGDKVISMAILGHVEASAEERAGYLKMRKAITASDEDDTSTEDDDTEAAALTTERYAELSAQEQFVLTITSAGFGKRTSSMEYRVTGRGGQGVNAIPLKRGGDVVACFPVEDDDQIMAVTNAGQSIRTPVAGISVQSRAGSGVTVFKTAKDEHVVSVAHLADQGDEDADGEDGASAPDASDGSESGEA